MQRIPGHKTVTVCVGAWEADIDEEIALLIEEIWKADIMTMNSCQGNRLGIVWIEFLTADDATRFLNIVAEYDKETDSLYNRIRHGWQRRNAKMSAPFWEYTTRPQDFAIQQQLDENDECLDEWHDG